MKNQIIDIDAEFDGIEFDEVAIARSTAVKKYYANIGKTKLAERNNNIAEGMKKCKPEHSAGAKKRSQNPEYLIKQSKVQSKPVIVPWGIYTSGKLAAQAYYELNPNSGLINVSRLIKDKKPGYTLITREEYIMLTGKDI